MWKAEAMNHERRGEDLPLGLADSLEVTTRHWPVPATRHWPMLVARHWPMPAARHWPVLATLTSSIRLKFEFLS